MGAADRVARRGNRLRECSRVTLHTLGVGPRAGVLRFERARERGHGLHVGALQQRALSALHLEHVPQIPRVEQQLFLRLAAALLRSPERHPVQATGKPLGGGKQLQGTERLANESIGARALRIGAGSTVRACEQDNRDVLRLGRALELRAQLQSGRAGHLDVEHDHVGARGLDPSARDVRTLGFDDIDVSDLERRLQQRAKPRIVVDQQDSQDAKPPFP